MTQRFVWVVVDAETDIDAPEGFNCSDYDSADAARRSGKRGIVYEFDVQGREWVNPRIVGVTEALARRVH